MKYAMYSHFTELMLSEGIENAADYAASHGFSAVEFLEFSQTPFNSIEEAKKAREVLEKKGLSVACYSIGVTLYSSPENEEKLKKRAEIAAALGSPYLHHTLSTSYSPIGELSFDTVMEDILPRAVRAAEYAKSLGVKVLYEEQGYYFNGIRNFGTFLSEMKSKTDNVGVCGDFGNILFVDGSPAEFFETFKADIKHVHFKDYIITDIKERTSFSYKDGKFLTEVPLGDGIADAGKCLELLKAVGYDGYFALEFADAFPTDFEKVVRRSMEFAEGILY